MDTNRSGAKNLAGETAIDFQTFGFERIYEFDCGLVPNKRGFCRGFERELARAEQLQMVLAEEGSGDLALNSRVCANDQGVVQVSAFSDSKFSPDVHRSGGVG